MRFFVILVAFAQCAVAQQHPYSNAWSYITSVETSDLQLAATTVTGTGGTDSHTIQAVAIHIESPGGRTASAFDYPSWPTGQATAYLSLCGSNGCEDGTFLMNSENTTELCGVTSTVLLVPVAYALRVFAVTYTVKTATVTDADGYCSQVRNCNPWLPAVKCDIPKIKEGYGPGIPCDTFHVTICAILPGGGCSPGVSAVATGPGPCTPP